MFFLVFKRARPRKKTIVPTFLVQTQAQKFTPIPSNGELLYRPKDVERITSMFYLLSKTKKENESTTLPMCVACFIRHRENGPGFSTRWTSASATSPASYTTFEELKFEIFLIPVSFNRDSEANQHIPFVCSQLL